MGLGYFYQFSKTIFIGNKMHEAPYFKILTSKSKISLNIKEQIKFGVPNGVYCTDLDESYAQRIPAPCEDINKGKHGQFVVMGRDRTGTLAEGAGCAGLERAGMIDLYVGPGSAAENKNIKFSQENPLDPSFITDASRIYITQTNLDIDKAFGIKSSSNTSKPVGASSYKKSAIGIKSDHVRIISREKMVLYCGRAHNITNSDKYGERNSNNDKILDPPRIELLTGNPEDLQPAVLGKNLIEYLGKKEEAHRKLINDIENLNEQLIQINLVLTSLSLGTPPFSSNVLTGVTNIIENISDSFNTYIQEINYIDKGFVKGSKSILSNSVFVS